MKKIILILAALPLSGCDIVQQAAEDQVRNEVSDRFGDAENELRSQADEHLNTLAPDLSNRIDRVQNSVETMREQREEIERQTGRFN